MELKPYQRKAVDDMFDGCVLVAGTGVGKTFTALTYHNERHAWRRLIVITTARKRDSKDWELESRQYNPDITVDSWNNIGRYTDVKGAFFIFDEQRLVGSGAWAKAFITIAKSNPWIMLSATPGDVWLDYCTLFVASGLYRNKTDFVEQHVRWKPRVQYPVVQSYIDEYVLEKHRRRLLVKMEGERKFEKIVTHETIEYDKELYDKVYKERYNPFSEKRFRTAAEWVGGLKRVSFGDFRRLEWVRSYWVESPRLIVFYNYNYELDMYRRLAQDDLVLEWNGQQKDVIPRGVARWVYLVQYTAGSEAWNCTETDHIVFGSAPASYRVLDQSMGRISRLNSPFNTLFYHRLTSNTSVEMGIRRRLDMKKAFNESAWARKAGWETPEMWDGDIV